MEVRKSNGSSEEFSRKKLGNVIRKSFKSAGIECTKETVAEIIDSLYVYDGILCSSIRKQLEERFTAIDEKILKSYKEAKDKKTEIEHFVEAKKAFIENYKKSSNTANATIDDNSNVANKNVSILNSEIHKSDNIQISRSMIMDKLKETFPDFNPKNYIKDLEHHIIYKNDESSFAGAISPYTYSAKEVVEVLYHGEKLLLPLELLYKLLTEEEKLVDDINIVYQKETNDLLIRDKDGNYTKATKVTKKKRHKGLVRVKTAFGEDLVVTEDHPMITDISNIENTTPAIDSLGKTQYKIGKKLEFKGKESIDLVDILPSWVDYGDNYIKIPGGSCMKRIINLDRDFGYIVGFFIGDGGYENTNHYLSITQRDKTTLEDLNTKLFNCIGVAFKITSEKDQHSEDKKEIKYILSIRNHYIFDLFRRYFKIQDKAQNKTLPLNILEFNEEFAKGILEGLIDSDGTVGEEDCSIYLRLSSRAGILQSTQLFRHFGYSVGNSIQSTPFSTNGSYKTNYTIWGVTAVKRDTSEDLSGSFKVKNNLIDSKVSSLKYHPDGECTITNIVNIESESSFLAQNDFIYDITTETHTFAMNNLLVHNCVSITMYPFLTNGIKNLGGLSARPKNIDSYCGMLCNLIFAVSAQFAGACAVSEALLFFDYFCKKEWGPDYYKHANSFYKIGPKLRELLNESHYWTDNLTELQEHDFGTPELNKLRNEIIEETATRLSKEELDDFIKHVKEDPEYTIKLGDGSRTILSQIKQYWQQIVYCVNQPCGSRGFQSCFTNFSYFDSNFFYGMFGNFYFPDGTQPEWESLKWLQKEFMMWFNEERLRTMLTFPVESVTLLFKDGKFQDEEMFNFVCEEYARGHSFFTYISDSVDSLSSCCRLKNKIQSKEFNLTNGNIGIQTGSKSVISFNLSRIIQDWYCQEYKAERGIKPEGKFDETKYPSLKKYITKITERVYRYHVAYNELLWDMYDANLLPVYKAGFIDLNKQYLTLGINGLNQAAEFLGITCNDNPEYSKFCQEIFSTFKEQNEAHKVTEGPHKLTFNTEQVPAESLAIKNYNWDKEDGYWVPEDTNLYASYVYKPNDSSLSVLEKIRMMGSRFVGDYLDGER